MKNGNSRPEEIKACQDRDERIVVLLGAGLLIVLSSLVSFFFRDQTPPAADLPPAHLLRTAEQQEFAPLFFLPIDLNQADAELLQIIPGIGPAISQRIIALRDKRNGYSRISELLDVPGIGPAKLAGIIGYCRLGDRKNENQPQRSQSLRR
ncbi:MAG: ComEA family DNA-binding protein [Thermodesulfobacteriota bacterium]